MQKLAIYNHGKDSIPWGEKPIALAEVAKQQGFKFISPDYQTSNDHDLRVKQLLAMEFSLSGNYSGRLQYGGLCGNGRV